MTVQVLFSGPFRVEYRQFYVLADSETAFERIPDAHPRDGRRCGADVPGVLFLLTALHTGATTVKVTSSATPPEDDGTDWAVVEDVRFAATDDVALIAWAYERTIPLDLPRGKYRVRYHQTPQFLDPMAEIEALETGQPVGNNWLHFWPLDENYPS